MYELFMNVVETLTSLYQCEIQSQNQEYKETPCYQETVGSGDLPVAWGREAPCLCRNFENNKVPVTILRCENIFPS